MTTYLESDGQSDWLAPKKLEPPPLHNLISDAEFAILLRNPSRGETGPGLPCFIGIVLFKGGLFVRIFKNF